MDSESVVDFLHTAGALDLEAEPPWPSQIASDDVYHPVDVGALTSSRSNDRLEEWRIDQGLERELSNFMRYFPGHILC